MLNLVTVSGVVRIPETSLAPTAVLHVFLESIRYTGERSPTILKQLDIRMAGPVNPPSVPFEIEIEQQACQNAFLRVHLDMRNNGEVSIGDYITTHSYPLEYLNQNHSINVELHEA